MTGRFRISRAIGLVLIGVIFIVPIVSSPGHALAMTPIARYWLGTPAVAGNYTVTLNAVEVRAKLPSLLVTLRYTIRNISPTPVQQGFFPKLRLSSAAGVLYEPLARPGPNNQPSSIEPGGEVETTADFQVPLQNYYEQRWLARVFDPGAGMAEVTEIVVH